MPDIPDLIARVESEPTRQQIDRMVMDDRNRPCRYGVAGPCFHPVCLEAHAKTIAARLKQEMQDG